MYFTVYSPSLNKLQEFFLLKWRDLNKFFFYKQCCRNIPVPTVDQKIVLGDLGEQDKTEPGSTI